MTTNSLIMTQPQEELNYTSDYDSYAERIGMMDAVDDDDLSHLSMGSVDNHAWNTTDFEEEILTDEDRAKIERWTRIREDGFEIINGIKYSETGSVIYSDYSDSEEEIQKIWENEERANLHMQHTALGILAKEDGDLQRKAACERIAAYPEAYEGIDIHSCPDYEDEGREDYIAKYYDLYLANGGITNEEGHAYAIKHGLRNI